jgi:RNA-binding protein 25
MPPGMPPPHMARPGMPWPHGGAPPQPGMAGPPPAKTSVYIGKISPLVDDDLMRRVLEACGEVRRCGCNPDADGVCGAQPTMRVR